MLDRFGRHPFDPVDGDWDGPCAICHGVLEHPDHEEPRIGPEWRPDPRRAGYFVCDGRPGWLRDPRGHWYSARDVDHVAEAVESVAGSGTHRLALTPADVAANEKELIERLRAAARQRGLIP